MKPSASTLAALALLGLALLTHASPIPNPQSAIRNRTTWWAFQPPKKPAVPVIRNPQSAIRNPIDAFILSKLNAQRLTLNAFADRPTLIRRLYFDLIGLPPTPEEVQSYLSDKSDKSYENLVDRLLASPHYGERWGRHWLDVVRFGETDGGEHNYERFNAWPYRDYVIDAFNGDLPYDQFIRDQISGDLLFPGDRKKTAATGFLVAGPWDQVSAELNKDDTMRKTARMDELDDMVTAVSATFLGLTVNCARCHDHKFDPIPTRDYYRMTAAFTAAGFGERSVATPEEKAAYEARLKPLRAELNPIEREVSAIEESVSAPILLAKYRAFDEARRSEKQRIPLNPLHNRNQFPPVTAKHFRFVILGQVGSAPRIERLTLLPPTRPPSPNPLPPGEGIGGGGTVVDWTGTESASIDKPVFVPIELESPREVSEIIWSTNTKTGARDRTITLYRFEYSPDGREWRELCSSVDHVSKLEVDLPGITEQELIEALTPDQRSRRADLRKRRAELQDAIERIPTPPKLYAVNPRHPEKAFLLERGSVLKPIEEVTPGALSCIPSLAPDLSEFESVIRHPSSVEPGTRNNPRLLLADWIANPRNPLTARVIVNRVWYHHFGAGIVNTPSDFGVMGDRPSHPELLDWLAVSFMENGWSLKWLHRQILTSRAYRQSSAFNVKAHAVDAANRLVWRIPLKRMDAETLRDSILKVTGSLNAKAGGPSFPLQKKGDRGSYIYKALDNDGPDVWRRAVYRFVVRGGERVMLDSFDCPDPSVATPQRQVSNTPVQALTLMNNAFVVRQADLFAQRLEREAAGNRDSQIRRAYLLAYGRNPTEAERSRANHFIADRSLSLFCRAILNSNEFIYVP